MEKEEAIRLAGHLRTDYPFFRCKYWKTSEIRLLEKLHIVLLAKLGEQGEKFPYYNYKVKAFEQEEYGRDVFETLMGQPIDGYGDGERKYARIAVRGSFDLSEYLSLDYPTSLLDAALAPLAYLSSEEILKRRLPDNPGQWEDFFCSYYCMERLFEEEGFCDEEDDADSFEMNIRTAVTDCAKIYQYFVSALHGESDEAAGSYRLLTEGYDHIAVADYVEEILSQTREELFPDISECDFLKIAPTVVNSLCSPNELNSLGHDDPEVMWLFKSARLRKYLVWKDTHDVSPELMGAMDQAVAILKHPFRTEYKQDELVSCASGEVCGDDQIFWIVSNDMDDYSANPYYHYAGMIFDTLYPFIGC